MKKSIGGFIIFFALSLSMISMAIAHPGRTDANGGHKDNKNESGLGSYHYHCGDNPAHLHTNGICPYSSPIVQQPATQTATEPPAQPPTEPPQLPTEPATQPPTEPVTQPATEEVPKETKETRETISRYYTEFPSVPNFGYIANLEPFNVYNENGIYVYQYDGNAMNSETARNIGVEVEKEFAKAGFNDCEEVENGMAIRGNGLLILFRYNNDNIFSVTIGEFKIGEEAKPKEISVLVNGETIEFDQSPENINGRIMIPIRFVVEKMNCTVEWDDNTKTVYVNTPDCPIEKNAIKSDNINVYVNNEIVVFEDQQPINKNSRILIPVRFVAEKLGYTVEWDGESQAVYIKNNIETDIVYKSISFQNKDLYEISEENDVMKVKFKDTNAFMIITSADISEYGKMSETLLDFTLELLLSEYQTQLQKYLDVIIAGTDAKAVTCAVKLGDNWYSSSHVVFSDDNWCYSISYFEDPSAMNYVSSAKDFMSLIESIEFR